MSGNGCALMTVLAVALSSWSCGSTAPNATPAVSEIVVSPASSTLAPSGQLPLRAEVQDGSGAILSGADVTWTVEDPRIVSISAAGVVTALAVGTSHVAANALGKSGLAIVTVKAGTEDSGADNSGTDNTGTDNSGADNSGAVATVFVAAPSRKLKTGDTMQLTATASDDKGNVVRQDTFYWSSSNTDKATVSASGVVSAKKQGDVTITARTSPTGGKSGSLTIEVKK